MDPRANLNKNDILSLIGDTPLVKLKQLNPNPRVTILAKMEGHNPGGSVKDRAALWMIDEAERSGKLKPGVKIIEPTSGNTGIALAMIASMKGYEIELVMPENSTVERVKTMKAFGAKVTLTAKERSMEGSIDYVREKVAKGGYLMLDQFGNIANRQAHYDSTGPEIWKDTEGKITHFVSSMGTTGTISGVSRYLKEQNPSVNVIGVQPKDGESIPGIRKWPEEYLPKIYDSKWIDRLVEVSKEEATLCARNLARNEGIFCGMSAGGAAHCAIRLASEISEGVIVTIICDRGDRYLSSPLFE